MMRRWVHSEQLKSPNEEIEWVLRLKKVRSGFDGSGTDGGVLEHGRCRLNMATEERESHMNRDER